jgi:hypothetical protein
MPMTQQHKQREDTEGHNREMRTGLIAEQLIHTLGEPGGLLKVQVRPLWENHYRVNVFIGGDAISATIANSYFVTADNDGNIVKSTPKITKQY